MPNFEQPMQDMPKQPHDGCLAGPAPPLCPAPGCRRRSAFRPCACVVQPVAAPSRDPWYIVRALVSTDAQRGERSPYVDYAVSRKCRHESVRLSESAGACMLVSGPVG